MRDVAAVAAQPLLSSHGLYADLKLRTPASSAIEYTPQYPLFSDFAEKRRWLLLPAGQKIDTSDLDHFRFPIGTKAVKEFSRDGKVLETRLIERVNVTGDQKVDYFMGTFVWLPDGSDAVLTNDGVDNVNGTTHDVPKQELCLRCHQGEPGAILGFSTLQLSSSGALATFAEQKLLSDAPKRKYAIPGNELQVRAIAAMQGNCAPCHSAGGSGALMRLRLLPHEVDLPFELTEIFQTTIGRPLTDWMPRPAEFTHRIIPGDPDRSALTYRMGLRSGNGWLADQMPPIATEQRNEEALSAVRAWIAAMPPDYTPSRVLVAERDAGAALDAGASDASLRSTEDAAAAPMDAGVPVAAATGDDAAAPTADADTASSNLDGATSTASTATDAASSASDPQLDTDSGLTN